jgi:hypothetical protein
MMKPFDQIISSAGISRAGTPSTVSRTACSNHASSTVATPLPELKMMSTRSPPRLALPSQCGNVTSVAQPAPASTAKTVSRSAGRTKMSKSFVCRAMPVYRSNAYAPPTRNGTFASSSAVIERA